MKNRASRSEAGDVMIIDGGSRLCGEVEVMSAKNSLLPLIACSVLVDGEVFLFRCEPASDANNMLAILRSLGGKCRFENGGIYLDCRSLCRHVLRKELTGRLRSSVFILGPLAARTGRADICYPGGCDIGPRPIDLHIAGLKALGVRFIEDGERIVCECGRLHGCDITLPLPSVGATENIMMAAATAEGRTIIRGAAAEPEIVDLQRFINACGGRVNGAGTGRICIDGVRSLHGTRFLPSGDRIVAGTFMTGCAVCGGRVDIIGADPAHLAAVCGLIRLAGAEVIERTDGVSVASRGALKAPGRIETKPYPGFPTDLQAPATVLAACASGTTYIIENLFENRFRHVPQLLSMGADITVCGRAATVRGGSLHAADVTAEDLRGGAALVLAALAAEGRSTVKGLEHIDRGYYELERKLSALGAKVLRTRM